VELNVVSDTNAGSKLTSANYSTKIQNYATENGKILESLKMSSVVYNISNDSFWYILFPEKQIASINDISNIIFYNTIKLHNLGGGNYEYFYYEIYDGTSWVLFKDYQRSNNDSINIFEENITSFVVSNNGLIQIRARVVYFQKKDYLNIGSYLIEYIYN
tara:strand:- start:2414 stop:2893 length:480 start_codon:yes stop_codon:yes gene_type:complete